MGIKGELEKRKLPTRQSRLICQRIYGKKITDSTWRSWRAATLVSKDAKWITSDQLLRLGATAHLRSQFPKRTLALSEVNAAELTISGLVTKAIEELDKGSVLGRDTPQFLKDFSGHAPHLSTLYRKIPSFSQKKMYPKAYILKAA